VDAWSELPPDLAASLAATGIEVATLPTEVGARIAGEADDRARASR
jgi:hypothetical protein